MHYRGESGGKKAEDRYWSDLLRLVFQLYQLQSHGIARQYPRPFEHAQHLEEDTKCVPIQRMHEFK